MLPTHKRAYIKTPYFGLKAAYARDSAPPQEPYNPSHTAARWVSVKNTCTHTPSAGLHVTGSYLLIALLRHKKLGDR